MDKSSLAELLRVSDYEWSEKMFLNNIIARKCDQALRKNLIEESLRCGQMFAAQFKSIYGEEFTFEEVLKDNGLRLDDDALTNEKQFRVLARYEPPKQIFINEELIQNITTGLIEYGVNHVSYEDVKKLIIGHEFFHYLEEQNQTTIYTRNKKIVLWRFLIYSHKSNLSVLSEIAAMAFTKEINKSEISPFLLGEIWKPENL